MTMALKVVMVALAKLYAFARCDALKPDQNNSGKPL
jgi:hypothetical protein